MAEPQFEGIARVLRTERQRKGLSQRELAELVGIGQSHISRIERGLVAPQLSTLLEISRALELEVVMVPVSRLRAVEAVLQDASPRRADADPEWEERIARKVRRVRESLFERRIPAATAERLRRTLADLSAILTLVPKEERTWFLDRIEELGDKRTSEKRLGLLEHKLRAFRARAVHREPPAPRAVYQLGDDEGEP